MGSSRAGSIGLVLAASLAVASPAAALGILYALDGTPNASQIFELDPATGASMGTFPAPSSGASSTPDGITASPDASTLFVVDGSSSNADLFQIDLAGNVLDSFSITRAGEGLTRLGDGTLAVATGFSSFVVLVDPVTQSQTGIFAAQSALFGLEFDGTRLIGLTLDGRLEFYTPTGTFLGSLTTGVSGLGNTLGLAYAGQSYFISEISNGTIYEVDLAGAIVNSFAAPAGSFVEGLDFVPEPGTGLLLAAGLALLAARRRSA